MDPHNIATLVVLGNAIGKGLIDLDIVLPGVILVRFALGAVGNLVVKDGPEHALAIMGIVSVKIFVVNKDGKRLVVFLQSLGDAGFAVFIERISRHA